MENGVWYILAALIMGWTGFCIYKWIKNRKRGGCGCGCTGCPHSGKCDGKKEGKKKSDFNSTVPVSSKSVQKPF